MPERPLLIFPDRDEEARQKMSAGYGRISKPDHATQVTRLDNRFTAFQQVMENRMAEFRLNPSGIEPEEVLVIEVAGNVTQFLSVCRNTEGIEWMGDIEADGLVEDELFYSGEEFSEGKPLNGRLLLSMTNQTGIRNLLTMWENWKENEDYDYPYGLNGWKKIFPSIIDIRRWGVQERFEETGVQDNWEFELQHGKDRISFELELWYRKPEELREESQLNVEELVNELDGEILNILDISEIRYHGLLVELPNRSIRELLADQDVSLVRCDQIMFFRPTGQSVPKVEVEDEEDREELEIEESVLGIEDYEMAVFDGLPIQNHNALRDYLIVDDPENFEEGYPVLKREHGTSISSIVINGDLNNESRLNKRIYLRPILKYDPDSDRERIPNNRLFIELLYNAIKRIFEGNDEDEPVAPQIKVVNISIGDPLRPFYNELSSVARLLDWCSFKYNVLFLISAGNSIRNIVIETGGQDFDDLTTEEIQEKTILSIFNDRRNRRLISPAESINSITVGASHEDSSEFVLPRLSFNLIQNAFLPSPISPVGSGFRRSVKPDIIVPGGKVIYSYRGREEDQINLGLSNFVSKQPGIKVAYPGTDQGNLNSIAYTCGTSNASAMATNFAGHIIEVLDELNEDFEYDIPKEYYPALIKSLMVHTASWGEIEDYLREILREIIPVNKLKDGISKAIGFGNLSKNRAYECAVNRASILGYGSLGRGDAHVYNFPIPPILSGVLLNKKLIITLAWFSPINSGRQNYRKAHLYFDPPMDDLNLDRDETSAYTAKRGTVQHEILKGTGAVPVVEGDTITIKVNCREDAGILKEAVKYGLCVTLESPDELEVPIYQQVRERVVVPVEVRAET